MSETCGVEIEYVTPGGNYGSVLCELASSHEGDCDSPQLLLRPGDTVSIPVALGEDVGW